MPSRIELTRLNTGRSPRLLGTTVYVLAILLGIAVTWSYFTEVDVVVRAPGIVRPDGEVVRITSEIGGTVKAVHVEEGDAVHTGDVLVRLDDTSIRLERNTVAQQIALLTEQGADIERKIRDAAGIYLLEEKRLATEIAAAREDLRQRELEHTSQMESATLRLEQAESEYSRHRQLFREGLISRQDADRFRTEFRLAEAQLEEISHRQPSEATLDSLLETRNLISAEFASVERDLRAEAMPIEAQLTELRSRLEQTELEMEYHVIRSPASGQVTLLPPVHPGEQITANTLVAAVAETPVRPIVEALVSNRSAQDIQPGQPARLRLDESNTVDGLIFSVSPDARFTESVNGAYRVLIAPDTIDLRLGLAVDVRLITRQERVLTLLFNRIERAFTE